MSIYHCSVKIISRSSGSSSVGKSAYRSGEKLHDERTGLTHDFTRKKGIVFSEVKLCEEAPDEYQDREKLWNAVEKIEKKSNSQLAREVEVALPIEMSREQQLECARSYIQENFIEKGMCADWALHDKEREAPNPHAHIMLTTRAIQENGDWAKKEKTEFARDEDGNKIPLIDPGTGEQKVRVRNRDGNITREKLWERVTVQANSWNDRDNIEIWRASWAEKCNEYLHPEQQIDYRSYKRQGIDQEPTIHEGYNARSIEERGGISDRCQINRDIRERNRLRDQIKEKTKELTKVIIEKAREFIERVRASFGDFREARKNVGYPRRSAERDREAREREYQAEQRERQFNETKSEIARTDTEIEELTKEIREREENQNERIRKLYEKRNALKSGRGTSDGEHRITETDTDALIREIRASTDRARATIIDSESRIERSEADREEREIEQERLDTERSEREIEQSEPEMEREQEDRGFER